MNLRFFFFVKHVISRMKLVVIVFLFSLNFRIIWPKKRKKECTYINAIAQIECSFENLSNLIKSNVDMFLVKQKKMKIYCIFSTLRKVCKLKLPEKINKTSNYQMIYSYIK